MPVRDGKFVWRPKKKHSTIILSSFFLLPLVHSKTGASRCGRTFQRCACARVLILEKETSTSGLGSFSLLFFCSSPAAIASFFLRPRHPTQTFNLNPFQKKKKKTQNSASATPTTRASARPSATTTSSASITGRRSRGSTRSTGSRRRRTPLRRPAATRAEQRRQKKSIVIFLFPRYPPPPL